MTVSKGHGTFAARRVSEARNSSPLASFIIVIASAQVDDVVRRSEAQLGGFQARVQALEKALEASESARKALEVRLSAARGEGRRLAEEAEWERRMAEEQRR